YQILQAKRGVWIMTEYVKAFIVKLLIFGVLTFSIFGIFTNASIMKLLLISLVVSAATFIGDVFILPRMNQVLAIVGDFAGILLLYWLIGGLVVDDGVSPIMPALAAAYFGTMAEAIYHIYAMVRLHEPDIGSTLPVRYQTEFAEEEEVDDNKRITMRTVLDSTVMANNIIINKYISCPNSI